MTSDKITIEGKDTIEIVKTTKSLMLYGLFLMCILIILLIITIALVFNNMLG